MIFISATRLKVKSIFYLPAFMVANNRSVKELNMCEGFLGGRELIDKKFTFWTLTMWTGDTAMKRFRNSVPHRKAMKRLPGWCDEASYIHWTQEEEKLPGWSQVYERMQSEGKTTKVRKPSKNHLTGSFKKIKWTKLQRNFEASKVGN